MLRGDHMEALLHRAGHKGPKMSPLAGSPERRHHWRPWQASGLAASAVVVQALRFPLSEQVPPVVRDVAGVSLRVHTWPLNRPRQLPLSASTASHRVQQHPTGVALWRSLPEARRRAFCSGGKIDFAGVLGSPGHGRPFPPAAAVPSLQPFDQACGRHLGIAEKAV